MEGLVDPRIFESRTGFLLGAASLVALIGAIVGRAVSDGLARRKQRVSGSAAGTSLENEQSRRAA